MSPFTKRFRRPALVLALPLLLTACGGSTTLKVETRTAPTPISVSPIAAAPTVATTTSLTPQASTTPSSVPTTAPTSVVVANTPVPAANTPVPATGSIEFKPATLVQGGTTVVYLNESASSATLRFQDKQYPMLHDGKRFWAMVGVNAFTPAGVMAASITYTPSGRQDSVTVAASITVQKRDFPVEDIELDDDTAALLDPSIVNAEVAQRAAIYSGFTAQRLWSGPFLVPGQGTITSIYGEGRSYNGGPVTDFHKGTDFSGNTGDPVSAAAAGRVAFAGPLKVRGNSVIIDHGAGVFTAYHHLSAIEVKEGQIVKAGDKIGQLGSTGLVTGPHLHWEVIVRGVEVDGRLWLQGLEIGP
ncbi:MAG: M23 family metallopeptidase [Dehalococcoidia bacterium]